MNIPYVTQKATRPKPWQGAILGICGFLTIVLATMVPEYVTTKGAIDNGVLFALLLGCVTPIYLVIREAWRCSTAKRIGNWFAYYRETSVTFDKLSMEINKHAVQSIDGLLKLGYLQNLHIDYENRFVELTADQRLVKANVYITVTCPSAEERIRLFREKPANAAIAISRCRRDKHSMNRDGR